MTNFPQIKEELQKFGLSAKQAEIYALLAKNGELRVQEIVKLSNIPRSSVYESLKGLFELGIAEEIVDDGFKRIRAYSVGTMRHGLDEKILQLKKLTTDLEKLEKTIPAIQTSSSNTASLRYYNNRSGARQLYWNTLKATNTVYVYSDWGRVRYIGIKFYENFVAESRVRNIREKVLINLNEDTLDSIRNFSYPGSPISRTKVEDIRVIDAKNIVIKGDTLIYDQTYAQVYLGQIEIHGFEIESSHFTETQRSIFETFWEMAQPIDAFL